MHCAQDGRHLVLQLAQRLDGQLLLLLVEVARQQKCAPMKLRRICAVCAATFVDHDAHRHLQRLCVTQVEHVRQDAATVVL